MDSNMQVLV